MLFGERQIRIIGIVALMGIAYPAYGQDADPQNGAPAPAEVTTASEVNVATAASPVDQNSSPDAALAGAPTAAPQYRPYHEATYDSAVSEPPRRQAPAASSYVAPAVAVSPPPVPQPVAPPANYAPYHPAMATGAPSPSQNMGAAPAGATSQPAAAAPVFVQQPAPAPQPIVVQQPAAAPAPQPIVVQQPAAAPAPQPIIMQQPAAAPAPQPIIVQQPAAAPAAQPIIVQQPAAAAPQVYMVPQNTTGGTAGVAPTVVIYNTQYGTAPVQPAAAVQPAAVATQPAAPVSTYTAAPVQAPAPAPAPVQTSSPQPVVESPVGVVQAPVQSAPRVGTNAQISRRSSTRFAPRSFRRFAFDTGTANGLWIESGTILVADENDDLETDIYTIDSRVAIGNEKAELGASVPYRSFEADFADEFGTVELDGDGFGDVQVWGKAIPIRTEHFDFGGGLVVTLPTGDEEMDLGDDELGFLPYLTMAAGNEKVQFGLHGGYGFFTDANAAGADESVVYGASVHLLHNEYVATRVEFLGRTEFTSGSNLDELTLEGGWDLRLPLDGIDLYLRPHGILGLTNETPDWGVGGNLALAWSAN